MNHILLYYVASVFLIAWGIAHIFPTFSVVRGFGDISPDNRRIITMEWIIEGATLIFTGLLIGVLTLLNPGHEIAIILYMMIVVFLIILAIISFLTGFRVKFLPFKLCPFILITAALLILIGELL
jgi:hypothetical protein